MYQQKIGLAKGSIIE